MNETMLISGFNGQEDRLYNLLSQGIIIRSKSKTELPPVGEDLRKAEYIAAVWAVYFTPKHLGRKPIILSNPALVELRKMFDAGVPVEELCTYFHLGRTTVYKLLKDNERYIPPVEGITIVDFDGEEKLFGMLSQGIDVQDIKRGDEGWLVEYSPKHVGRKPTELSEDEIHEMEQMRAEGRPLEDICLRFDIGKTTAYKILHINNMIPERYDPRPFAVREAGVTWDICDHGDKVNNACRFWNISRAKAYQIIARERELRRGSGHMLPEVREDVERLIADPDFADDFSIKYGVGRAESQRLMEYVKMTRE